MTEHDSADTTYADGKRYTLTIPVVTDETSVKYRFVFSDGVNEPVGYGATERTLTINP